MRPSLSSTRLVRLSCALLLLLFSALAPNIPPEPAHAATTIIYVNINGNGPQNNLGSSWDDPFTSLQDALLEPPPNSEIWVAAGIYYPDVGFLEGDNNRQSTFQLQNSVAIYGGFAGTESRREQRDWVENLTILSGDIDQNDSTDDDGVVRNPAVMTGSNAYHVVSAGGTDATALLDGFTITAGNANGGFVGECGPNCGAGLDSTNGSPTLANLTFSGNHAAFGGAGIFLDGSSPTLTNVLFSYNRADMYGGGVYPYQSSNAIFTNVTFRENSAGDDLLEQGGGGAISTYQSDPLLTNVTFEHNQGESGGALHIRGGAPSLRTVTFTGNYAITDENGGGAIYSQDGFPNFVNVTFAGNRGDDGGAIYAVGGRLTLANILFSGNYAGGLGGGIYAGGESTVNCANITFSGNQAGSGGAMYGGGSSIVTLLHTIIWGNSTDDTLHLRITSNNLTLTNSLVQDQNPGGSNLDGTNAASDPRFVQAVNCGDDGCSDDPATLLPNEAANDDYGDLRLRGRSPALDAGDNSKLTNDSLDVDQDGNMAEPLPLDRAGGPRVLAVKSATAKVDMGAYERANTAPTAAPGGPYSTNEGGSISLNGSGSSDDGGITNYIWDCTNDGNGDVTSGSPTGSTCSYADSGSYTLRLSVKDALNASGTATAEVGIANVAPVYTPDPNQSTGAGVAKSFSLGSFSDHGAEGSWEVTIDWGDNSALTSFTVSSADDLPAKSHAYATPGTFNVVVTVDDGEAEDNGGFQVVVNPAPPGAPSVSAAAPQTATAGTAKSFGLGSFKDVGDGLPWAVTVDWDDGSATTQFTANATGNLAKQSHTYAAAGSYDVLVTVSDGELSGSASFRVTASDDGGGPAGIGNFLPLLKR